MSDRGYELPADVQHKVTRCVLCPLLGTGDNGDWCGHPETKEPADLPINSATPKWCPLRKRALRLYFGGE